MGKKTVSAPAGPRRMKGSLMEEFGADVRPHLVDGAMPEDSYAAVRNNIHTSYVSRAIASRVVNPVINCQPPTVANSISRLPRQTQRILSQLRSGFSNKLASYRARVGQAMSDLCPDCLVATQDTRHLFDCAANPTRLEPLDLWHNPVTSANFLSTTSSFSDLALSLPSLLPSPVSPPPPLLPPSPLPPPQPPPSSPLLSPISSQSLSPSFSQLLLSSFSFSDWSP